MFRRLIGLSLLAALFFALPGSAMAQRRGHSGPAMSPFGQVINPTQTPEWRQAGGNMAIYEQIMEQKALAAQQKVMQKQQQEQQKQQAAYLKWLKDQAAKKEKGKPVDPAYQQMLDEEAQYKAAAKARADRIAAKAAARKHPARDAAAKAAAKSAGTPPAAETKKTDAKAKS